MNAMTRAWEIRREAAKRWNCQVSEIVFSECLKMAHAGLSVPQTMEKPSQELFDARIKLAMAVDRAYNPNNRDVNNLFRGLDAKEALKTFDVEHPEVKAYLDEMYGDDDEDDDYEYSSGRADL